MGKHENRRFQDSAYLKEKGCLSELEPQAEFWSNLVVQTAYRKVCRSHNTT
jgi:hypothetical protein